METLLAFGSTALISISSLVSVWYIARSKHSIATLTFVLINLACGTMLGNAFIHLGPESFEFVTAGKISSMLVSLLWVGGYLLCFFLESYLNLHCHHSGAHVEVHDEEHDHDHSHGHIHPTGHMALISHAVDNFTDGIVIGAAFLVSIPVGLCTALSIISHEIPLEFGGFGVLVKAGYSRRMAVIINFCSGLIAMLGTGVILYLGSVFKDLPMYSTPLCGGIVSYIVCTGLMPHLSKEPDKRRALIGLAIFLLGLGIMIACKFWELSMLG
jgi:zinc and cadmium transporter